MREAGLFGVTICLRDGLGDRFFKGRGAIGFNVDLTRMVVSCKESDVRREWKRKYICSTDNRSALDPKTHHTATEQRRSKVKIDFRLLSQLGGIKTIICVLFLALEA
jgi:hypothetical protein